MPRAPRLIVALAVVLTLGAGCAGNRTHAAGSPQAKLTLRLGYYPNLTHATALAGVKEGIFARTLGPNITLTTATFNAGPAAVEALFSGAIDATYVGPNPAINAFQKSKGRAIRIIAGATSGGAFLVVKPNIRQASDLRGKKIASPQLGNTQDVALRSWLRKQGLSSDAQGGGDVSVVPQDNAQTLETFRSGRIDGAWVPEPWATRLVQEAGAKVLVDESTLWPGGGYVTTLLVVRTEFLRAHRDAVERLLKGHVEATRFVNDNPAKAQQVVNAAIGEITGKTLSPSVVAAAWKHLTFTNDPLLSNLRQEAAGAHDVGLLPDTNLAGIADVSVLNRVLRAAGLSIVSG